MLFRGRRRYADLLDDRLRLFGRRLSAAGGLLVGGGQLARRDPRRRRKRIATEIIRLGLKIEEAIAVTTKP